MAAALLFFSFSSFGQRYMGIATGNWSGTYCNYLNPANIADARAHAVTDLVSFNAFADNDLVKLNFNKLSSPTSKLGFDLLKSDHVNMILPNIDIRLLGGMMSYERNSYALTTRVRFTNQLNNFDQRIMGLISNPPTAAGAPYNITAKDFNWTTHAWTEVRATFAREVYNQMDHVFKAGITITRLGGIGFAGIRGSVDGQFYPGNDSLHSSNSDITYATSFANSSNQISYGPGTNFGKYFGHEAGSGWGFDIGVAYEFRPDGGGKNPGNPASNKYRYRVTAALVDVGSIKYKNAFNAHLTADGSMSAGDLAGKFGNYRSFADYAGSRGFTLDTGTVSTKVKLPASLNLCVDYHITKALYVNATYFANLVARAQTFGTSIYNQLTITPRVDTKAFTLGIPLTYSSMSGFKAGMGIRLGGIVVGSDDLLGLIGDASGANAYAGLYIPIHKKFKDTYRVSTFPGDR